jgi:hypothetical protein
MYSCITQIIEKKIEKYIVLSQYIKSIGWFSRKLYLPSDNFYGSEEVYICKKWEYK